MNIKAAQIWAAFSFIYIMVTGQTVFSIKDFNTDLSKISSRAVSLKSVLDNINNEYEKYKGDTDELAYNIEQLISLFNKVIKSTDTIIWAAKQLILLMNVLCFEKRQYIATNAYGGKTTVFCVPNGWVWKAIYEIYAPYIKGGLMA